MPRTLDAIDRRSLPADIRQGRARAAKSRMRARLAPIWRSAALAMLMALGYAAPAQAIPSPDLAVNFLSSAAQVFGLLTVVVGGMLFGRKGSKAGGRRKNSAGSTPRWLIVGLSLAMVAAVTANVLQWAGARDARNDRLQASLIRPSVENGQGVGDITLKTLSYSDQLNRADGITTDQLAALLEDAGSGTRTDVNLIDLREPEEKEAGFLPQLIPVRYPDLGDAIGRLGLTRDKPTVLLCYSGNRSSESCAVLAAQGIPCKFVVGGFEKWNAEGRAVSGASAGADLRAIPDYPNAEILLDTPDVKELVAAQDVLFVDVRYPDDFAAGHLPGAVNMPIRKMTTPEMTAAIDALPRKPVIAACYDKRSCFYAKILGLRLSRTGFDYRGRYTVPQEYFVPRTPRAHIAAWQAENSNSLLDIVSGQLARFLAAIAAATGSLPLAIFGVVLILRALILPFTAKTERDQAVIRTAGAESARLRETLGDDRVRLSRAMMAYNRRHRLTPGLNMVGIIIQVPLFLAFFFAVDTVARTAASGFLWMADIGQPDPLHILPVLLGALVFLHLHFAAANHTVLRVGLRLAAAAGLIAITVAVSGAVNMYLVLSIGLMALQSQAIRTYVERSRQPAAAPRGRVSGGDMSGGVLALADLGGASALAGGKAGRLAEIVAAGIDVPDGFVITSDALRAARGADMLSARDRARIDSLWRRMGIELAAVRSSGLNEDGDDRSYAGVFETVLNVRRDGLSAAVQQVYDSFHSDSASVYGGQKDERGAILIQKMVDAEYAGVMFTEHPNQSGSVLVELVEGLGVTIADGTANPDAFQFGRFSGRTLDPQAAPIDLSPLVAIGRRLESRFGTPQDVEWAYADGRFLILQSRDITALSRTQAANPRDHVVESERHRLLALCAGAGPDEQVFVQNELSELLPRPTRFSLSFMEEMWRPGGSTDLACRELGMRYDVGEDDPPFVNAVFGGLYVNRREEQRRMRRASGVMATYRLTRMASAIEDRFRNEFLPAFHEDIRLYEAADLGKFSDKELFTLFDHVCTRFLTEDYVQAHVVNIAASFYVSLAERQLAKRGLSPAAYLACMPPTVVIEAMAMLARIRSGKTPHNSFLDLFGHRAPVDYELADPRYIEDAALVKQLVDSAHDLPDPGSASASAADLPGDPALRLCLERAGQFQQLKEEAKHHCLREFAVIRRILLAIDARVGLDGAVFQLTLDEVRGLHGAADLAPVRALIAERRVAADIFANLPVLPSELTPAILERLPFDGSRLATAGNGAALRGNLVAGEAPIRGRARVAMGMSLESLEDGDILITRFMHPHWAPALPRVSGVVTEVGGWLSHAAILAREYNVPTIVGVRGAMDQIATGDEVQLNPDGSVELV